jgi:uncharacterized protein YyaL (SSP411 family)
MLYDNAQLISLYAQAYQVTGKQLYAKTIHQTLQFINRELTHEQGYFYSALDADSEGVEGKFYTWTYKEIQEVLGDDAPLYGLYFSVDAYGNWEDGTNILYKTRTDEELEQLTGKHIAEIELMIEKCNQLLLDARGKRIRPGLDDKMITSWNALSESQKNSIKAQASTKLLESQYQIDNFWSTRDLREVKADLINESSSHINESSNYETPNAYMDAVRAGFRNRFKR